MGLVSDRLKIIFVHIYKNAGMSIRHKLAELDEDVYTVVKGHADVKEIKDYLDGLGELDKFNNYHKFAVVRNPYNWLISVYNYIKSVSNHPLNIIAETHDVNQFIIWYTNNTYLINERLYLNGKIQLQTDYLSIGGKIAVDTMLKFENLDYDFKTLMGYINVPDNVKLDYHNSNNYDKQIEQLTHETINFINYHYYSDFENFEYPRL